ncbi:alpha/beta hydrolase [Fusibacter ferrireducens]|uniref:Alpha/beta hydrolase n=1 Tax=Fusibacter ferrireducens TaxID=2785058 RepID=A0ABR9ZY00_9FIRM|nr:alpha/beta hydrolase [Fusibacter ferrireducens]MBF4694444.1 alpha/beta hydrolase [Fusibacter ferrireducens]
MSTLDVLTELRVHLEKQPILELDKELDSIRKLEPSLYRPSDALAIEEVQICAQRTARIYRPLNCQDELLPGVFWIHGGGYVLGHPQCEDQMCAKLALEVPCIIVSLDYRLAPEYPYPAGLEDCYTGLKWLFECASTLGVDRKRIAIAGPSAGGGLTAALTLLVRDRGEVSVSFQMPLYPMIDHRNENLSNQEITKKTMPKAWNKDLNAIAWDMYLKDVDRAHVPIYASPALEKRLEGLPPTYTCVGQLDPFRDETIDYVQRLAQAGVPVEFHLYPGCYHGFDALGEETEVSKMANDMYVKVLKKAFYK